MGGMMKITDKILAALWILNIIVLCVCALVFFWDKPQTLKNTVEFFIEYWYLTLITIGGAVVVYIKV